MLWHSQLLLNSATELVVVLQQMVSQAQFWNFPVFIYLFISLVTTQLQLGTAGVC